MSHEDGLMGEVHGIAQRSGLPATRSPKENRDSSASTRAPGRFRRSGVAAWSGGSSELV
jgi:hypothetical protein